MPTLETIAPPPAPKPATAPAVEPAKPAVVEPVKPVVAATPKKGADPIAERIKALTATGVDPGQAKPVEPAPAVAVDTDSDAALNTEIEATTKSWAPGEKKAFTKRVYENRDLKRQVKELEGKITSAEAKGTDTAALEAKLAAAEEKQAAAEAKLAAAPSAPTADVEEIKTKLTAAEKRQQELEQELSVAAVERTDEWNNAITKPKKQITDSIAEIAKKHEMNPRQLQAALYGTDEEQTAVVEGLTGPEQTKFYNLALRAQEIDGRAETLRTNAAEALGKITERRKAEGEQATASQRKAFATAYEQERLGLEEALSILTPVEGSDEATTVWNKSLASTKQPPTDALDPSSEARMRARAAVFPNLVGALQAREGTIEAQAKQIAEQAVTIAKFESNRPGAEVTPKDGDAPAVKVLPGAKGTAARIMAAVGGIR